MANKRIMYIGGSWGNAIYFLDDDKSRIYGFKDRYNNSFAEGSVLFDLANHIHEDTIPLYYISNIEYADDPRDMFFADTTLIGNVENPKDDYPLTWFKNGLGKLRDEYRHQLELTSPFKFKQKAWIKEILKTLDDMAQSN